MHLADVASLELLAFFGVELRTAPILLVVTCRDIEVHPTHPLVSTLTREGYEPSVSRLPLRGPETRRARFVAEATGVEPSPLVSALHQRTDGNPLFLGELIRLLQADNELSPSAAVAPTVPHEVRAVITRRLADQPPTTFRLLESRPWRDGTSTSRWSEQRKASPLNVPWNDSKRPSSLDS